MANADTNNVESPSRDTVFFAENNSTEPATVQEEATFPDPGPEVEEIEGEIDTNTEIARQAGQDQSSCESFILLSLELRRILFLEKKNTSDCLWVCLKLSWVNPLMQT